MEVKQFIDTHGKGHHIWYRGTAICLNCAEEWEEDTTDRNNIVCPWCGQNRGIFKFKFNPSEPVEQCACGNKLFYITYQGIYCPNCGEKQSRRINKNG